MDSQSSPQNKGQRRKRKDPESRDYGCKCGKSYLSYAAAYTHVKNKHSGDKQFLDSIAKPEREKLKRGRPKQKKVVSVTSQAQKLSIVQQAILSIYQNFRDSGDINTGQSKVVLEGNQQLNFEQLIKFYDELVGELGDPGVDILFNRTKYGKNGQLISQFIEALNKHFLPNIAVKVIWFVNFIVANCSNIKESEAKEGIQNFQLDFQKMTQIIQHEKVDLLWEQNLKIPQFIHHAFEKWGKHTWNLKDS